MTNRICLSAVMLGAAVATVIIAGCGGGGAAPSFDPTTTGTLTGVVFALGSSEGSYESVEGAQVQIGTRSGATDNNGRFTIAGAPAGLGQELTVTPPGGYALVSNAPITVNVTAGQTNELPAPILVIADSGTPPLWP